MPIAAVNGTTIAYEESGSGFPLIWVHEFAGSMESWEQQVHYFSRRYRVITYNARGYEPSGVPTKLEDYSQDHAVEDLYGLMKHLGIEQAHVGGLSMGGSCVLHFGIRHPEMAKSLIISSAGTGSDNNEEFKVNSMAVADRLEQQGPPAFEQYGSAPTRQQLKRKDPTGFETFMTLLKSHSPLGSAMTQRGVQAGRPPIYVWEKEMEQIRIPTLILCGDEDDPCVDPSVFMKRHIPTSGLAFLPQSGHPINLEEPALFNQLVADFLTAVEAGKWHSKV